MDNKERPRNIYLMGIGGTGMGAFAGLLKQNGHHVFGSDNAVYSPMKEKLAEWGISYRTPYDANNLADVAPDLVIIGNVIRRDNAEALAVVERKLSQESFPSALNQIFLKRSIPIVASGTHGKTTCSALLSHTLYVANRDPGFLIGGIPRNFGESFRSSSADGTPFVVEGDEYDTAYFDKRPKFIHYDPRLLLVTSLEFDHGDIYRDLDAVIAAFASLFSTLSSREIMIVNGHDVNIRQAITRAQTTARIFTYGDRCDYEAVSRKLDENGVSFTVRFKGAALGDIALPLFGEHNVMNALGCYGILHQHGLSHDEIERGYTSFLGVKRRLEERFVKRGKVVVDDFAHHPSAVVETIKAAKLKYPRKKICAIFEPRSATTCMKIFEERYQAAFLAADRVLLAPVGRSLPPELRIDTKKIALSLNDHGISAQAFDNYSDLESALLSTTDEEVWLFMSNGDFHGLLARIENLLI